MSLLTLEYISRSSIVSIGDIEQGNTNWATILQSLPWVISFNKVHFSLPGTYIWPDGHFSYVWTCLWHVKITPTSLTAYFPSKRVAHGSSPDGINLILSVILTFVLSSLPDGINLILSATFTFIFFLFSSSLPATEAKN